MSTVKRRNGRRVVLAIGLIPLLSVTGIVDVEASGSSAVPEDLAIPDGPVFVDRALSQAAGPVDVVVQLSRAPLTQAVGEGAKQGGALLDRGQQQSLGRTIKADQDAFLANARAMGAVETSRLTKVLNAVTLRIDAEQIGALAALAGVRSIRPVGEYRLDLSETVPYIGATTLQNAGVDGTGVTVAVLDSGIDYTHDSLGGAGVSYTDAYGTSTADPRNTTTDGLFPTAKVVGGYDFVGEVWPNGPLAPDPDPIDLEGHGTHVADIIAGSGGVAPGASLLAVKVCSAVATSCSGVALLQGMEFAVDPNGDGSIDDAADVINMSLGSSYGQIEDDLSLASTNAIALGVTVVASAGNSADRPYIVGSPSSTPGVISVAQTQVPSAVAFPLVINSPASIAGVYPNTATVDWAPIGAGFANQDVVFTGSLGSSTACGPLPAGSLTGKVALINRGTCSISVKVDNAANAGAVGVLIGLIAPGDAVTFSFGGGSNFVPTLVITLSTANAIRSGLAAGPVNVSVSSAVSTALVGSMVGSSSRGPSMTFDAIKPDIGAPGASLSAIAGTETGTEAFGGTSGAAPMVAGAAALVIDALGPTAPRVVKARLMGSAETNVYTNPATQPGVLAPITRIGGGEVRVDRAVRSTILAWAEGDSSANAASLSFGFQDAPYWTVVNKRLVITNAGATDATYTLTPSFRYADDAANGAVTVTAPSKVKVAAGSSKTVVVKMTIDATRLPIWTLDSGARQGDGARLNTLEYDGYLQISKPGEAINVPWHVLPRKAAETYATAGQLPLNGGVKPLSFINSGLQDGVVELMALDGTDRKDYPKPLQPQPGDNFVVPDIKAVGSRDISGVLQFGINFWNQWSHPAYPVGVEIDIDTDRDGDIDRLVFTQELTGFGATGQVAVFVQVAGSSSATAFFFLDADLNASNMILTVPYSALGITPGTQIDYSVITYDNYFTGLVSDSVGPFTITPSTPKFTTSLQAVEVPAVGTRSVDVSATAGGATASPTQTGILALYRTRLAKQSAQAIVITP
jgi:subtilisin family serine protease